jgi:hypothetical protein
VWVGREVYRMRRLTAYFVFVTCFMLTQIALPRLSDGLWGGKSLGIALVFLAFPLWLWIVYFFAARPEVRREEAYKKASPQPEISDNLARRRPYLSMFAALHGPTLGICGVWTGMERFSGVAAPLWFRLVFLACAVGCGVLGFFLGWEDVRKFLKERRVVPMQPVVETAPEVLTPTVTVQEEQAESVVATRRG